MELRLSKERIAALEELVEEGKDRYERTYKHRLSDKEVVSIIRSEISQHRAKLFMKTVGAVSDADLDYLASRLKPAKDESPAPPAAASGNGKGNKSKNKQEKPEGDGRGEGSGGEGAGANQEAA